MSKNQKFPFFDNLKFSIFLKIIIYCKNYYYKSIKQLKCQKNVWKCLKLINIGLVIEKKFCEKKLADKKNFLTNKTYILCSFQKCNFHYWHKYIHAKKRRLKVFSLYAYHYHSHSHTHYQVNMPAPTCKLRQHASLLPRKKNKQTDRSIYQFAIAIEKRPNHKKNS